MEHENINIKKRDYSDLIINNRDYDEPNDDEKSLKKSKVQVEEFIEYDEIEMNYNKSIYDYIFKGDLTIDFNISDNSPMYDQLVCSICQSVTIDPHMINKCQHTFCKNCITKFCDHVKKEYKCPVCRGKFVQKDVIKNILQCNIIDGISVKCCDTECDWSGLFSELYSHLKDNCKKLYACECLDLIKLCDKLKHKDECDYVKISCECGTSIIKKNFQHHLEYKCPESIILCDQSKRGCFWKGKRIEYDDNHYKNCQIRKLYRKVHFLQKPTQPVGSNLFEAYKSTECYLSSGWNTPDHCFRMKFLLSCTKTYHELGYPISLGYDQEELCIYSIYSNSAFEFNPKKFSNKCFISIHPENRIMCVTLDGGFDRFFVIPTQGIVPKIERSRGKINMFFEPTKDKPAQSPILFAHRAWVNFKNEENPYTLELTGKRILGFSVGYIPGKSSVEKDALFSHLNNFVTLEGWG